MSLIKQVMYYMNMVGACIVVAGLLVLALLWYLLKVKKIAAKKENINTSYFKREDSISYVPIRDMLYKDDLDSDGIISLTDTLFIGGLSVQGFDYNSASANERIDAQVNSIAFTNIIEEPTSFRQSVRAIDLSANIEEYVAVTKRIAEELMQLDAEYQNTLALGEDYVDEPEEYEYYKNRLLELQRIISAKNHQLDECKGVTSYMQAMSKDSAKNTSSSGQKTSQILFAYQHNPDLYSTELSKEEIYLKAQEALNTKTRSYADALAYCHFRAKRLSCRELIGLIRKHNFPLTGEDNKLEDLLDSSYTSLFVSCDSLVERQKEKIGEEAYVAMLTAYEEQLQDMLKQQQMDIARETKIIKEESYEQALYEMRGVGSNV